MAQDDGNSRGVCTAPTSALANALHLMVTIVTVPLWCISIALERRVTWKSLLSLNHQNHSETPVSWSFR